MNKKSVENSYVVFTQRGATTILTLNRPQQLNPIGLAMRYELMDRMREAIEDISCRTIVITGAGGNFTAGGNVKEMKQHSLDEGRKRASYLANMFKMFIDCPKPVISAIEGNCMGMGVSIVGASDFAIAADNARFSLAFIKVNLMPDLGATWSLPRKMGYRKTMELAATGDHFTAAQALEYNLLNSLTQPGQSLEKALVLADKLNSNPPAAFAMLKRALNGAADTIESTIANETESCGFLNSMQDHGEAAAAFKEKRKPVFKGQ